MQRIVVRTALVLTALALVGFGALAWAWAEAPQSNVGELEFSNELRIPPLAEPARDEAGRATFELELREGTAELMPGTESETWGINGPYLGPTLRAERGERVRIAVRNELPEPTTIHWHGMHLPANADGGPHQVIEPGATWTPEWTIDQPPATLWYHPHLMGETEEHVYRGLAGMFILDDPAAAGLELPSEYGVDDVPVIVQDKKFEDDGSLDDSQSFLSATGFLGDEILVNGTWDPYFEATTRLVRLRLLNASNARIYNFGFDDEREFSLIATEGGLLSAPAPLDRIQLSPGERAEIVVELAPGERTLLRSYEPELGGGFIGDRLTGGDDSFDILEIRAADKLEDSPPLPAALVEPEGPTPAEASDVRSFELGGTNINGLDMDMGRIDAVVEKRDTEIWEVTNKSGTPHSFHVHDVRFRVLEVDGSPPPASLSGLKDTIYVPPDETVRLLTSFEDYADPETPYMFHCHLLEHEDRGMMGQFVVVEPGQSAGETPTSEHSH
jgi:FtsP/CotA-like multicopper oxidase with cupredoxin domain